MDSQWIGPVDAFFDPLPPWVPISPDGHNVVVPWSGYFTNSQPPGQGFTPDTNGPRWGFNSSFDQSVGVVATFPSTSYANYNHDAGDSMIPTFDIRRSSIQLIPQRRYSNSRGSRGVQPFEPEASIYFDTSSGPGFSMQDALDRNFKALLWREDPMFSNCTAISLRFEFEGYKSWTRQVKTRDSRKVPNPIPREKLTHEVAKSVVSFLENRKATVDATAVDSVAVKEFFLVSLDHVSKGSWQPQFMIVRDA